MNKSLSQLSISQYCVKKVKEDNAKDKNSSVISKKKDNQQNGSIAGLAFNLLPRYLTVFDRTLKQTLSTIENANLIIPWLDTQEKLKSFRELAHVVNMLHYFNLQRDLWQAYYSVDMKGDGWATHISRSTAKEHRTCATYGRSQKLVEQRLSTIEHQLKRTAKELERLLSQLPKWTDKAQPPINSIVLSTAIETLVNHGQKRLHEEFKHREMMLKFDVNDHHLITAVYNLKPDENQIVWMKEHWKATADELHALEEMEVLRKRISLQRLSPSFDNLVDQSTESLQKMLSRTIINCGRRAALASRCSKLVAQYKFEMMALSILAAEDSIRGYKQVAADAKSKLLSIDNDPSLPSTGTLLKAIEERTINMRKRAEQARNHKIQTFFDEASMVINEDGNLNLSPAQMSMLIKGVKYIILCQSRFSKASTDTIVKQQYTSISAAVQQCLDDHGAVAWEPEEKEAFPVLNRLLHQLQSKPLPRKLGLRARREHIIMNSICQLLSNRPDIIIRRADKSKV
ncbi:unnamed protein product [Rotaria sp. Silwood2]|nr:unnamed protein product [Rotaria sp. Silwood2]CAF4588034.1 unnamed protein product [Rotaria sp. Silwood2]